MKKTLAILLFFAVLKSSAQDYFNMYEKEITIPTYMVDEPDKVPYFYTGRAYQGAQGRVYPYAYDGNLTDEKKDVTYKGLFMENKFLELCVLPELGGRLYYMMDKTNGYDVIYRNNVIKPSLIGMLGAWISGGIEWNVPHHHRASTYLPTDYKLVENNDGSKTIWVGELELRHQVRWMVGLTMFPNNAIVRADIRYINQTSQAHPFLIWANTAVHTNESYQVIYPPMTEYTTFHRKIDFTRWPISSEEYMGFQFNNTDISMWKNIPDGGSFFAWEDQGQFVAGIDHGRQAGLCVVGNKHIVIGKKLWTWGTSERADMWEKILTDEDGPYIEIMTGAYSNNQPDYSWCHPYFTKEATMYFMPLRGMSDVKESTLNAAINFEMAGDNKVLVEVHGYADFEDVEVSIKNENEMIWNIKTVLSPANPKSWSVNISDASYYDLSVEVKKREGQKLVSYRPQRKPGNPMPKEVKPPKKKEELETVEELVFTGLRLEQIFNPLVSPLPYYKEAVKREPHNAFANLRLGSWYLKEGMFKDAETHLQLSADRRTTDYTRAKSCEAFYLLGLTKLALNKELEAYENFYKASWDYAWYGASHLQMAMIQSKKTNYGGALEHIERALSVDANNSRACEIKLSLLRKLERKREADSEQNRLIKADPLNLYVFGEQLFLGATGKLVFKDKMRGEVQNYLDLAVKLGACGLYEDAIIILNLASEDPNPKVKDNPLVYYYLGYYYEFIGEVQPGRDHYRKASQMKTDFCFPFRYETEKVLAAAIEQNSEDFKAWYYWGNLLYDHQPDMAIKKWEKSIELNNEFALAQRNLAFAADHFQKDPQKAKKHISLAISADPNEAQFYFEQDNYALKVAQAPETRLENLREARDIASKKDNLLARKIALELLCGSVDVALDVLQHHHFRKVEGVGNIHNTWVNAWLLKGKKLMVEGEPEEAMKCFEKTLEYPENLEIGKNNREGQSHYFMGLVLEKLNRKKLANTHYKHAISMNFGHNELYYKGMAHSKLGNMEQAGKIFEGLIERADTTIAKIGEGDFFSIFGNRDSDNVRLAEAYTLKGLGYWGLGLRKEAEDLFKSSLEEDPSNFVAKTRLFD